MKKLFTAVSIIAASAFAAIADPVVTGNVFGTPINVSTAVIGAKASALAIEGNILYCGVSGVLNVLDVSTPTNPVLLGSVSGLYHIRQIAVENGLVAISSRSAGAWLIDATTPTAPRILSHFETVEQATGIDIAGNLMAIGQRTTGVEFVDITDRAHPEHIRMVKTQESQSCRYENGILYSGDWSSGLVNAIDVTDMSNASIIGQTKDVGAGLASMQGNGDGFDLDGRYIYASTGHHRKLNGNTSLDVNYGWGHALEIWDRSDPTDMKFVSRTQFDKFYKQGDDWWSCQEADGWVFCSDTHNGLYAVDARDPTNPIVVDRFTDQSPNSTTEPSRTVNSVVLGNGVVYTTVYGSGLWVIPCAQARYRYRPRGAEPTASNLAWREPYATPADSHFKAWKPPVLGPVHSVVAYGGRYYAGCGAAGAYIIDARTLRTIGRIPCAYACDVKICGDQLFIAQGDEGIGIYSLDNPERPREVRRITTFGGNLTHVEWMSVPTPRWVIVHARCETGKWWFLDLYQNRTTYPSNGPSAPGATWVRAFAPGLVGGKWLGYTHTHYFPKWYDMSGDIPDLLDTEDPDATGDKSKRPNYIEQGTCTPIAGDRLLIANRSVFTLLDPGQDHNSDGSAWPTFGYANSSLKPPSLCWWDGGVRVGLATTQGRKVQLADFTVADRPNLLWQEDTAGNPENGFFAPDGRLLVPCGYQGLLVEKREGDGPAPEQPSAPVSPWFASDAATGTATGGAWTSPPESDGGAWRLYDDNQPAVFDAYSRRGGVARLEVVLANGAIAAAALPSILEEAVERGARAAFLQADEGGELSWRGLALDGGAPAWKTLYGATPETEGWSVAAAEVDPRGETPRVSYLVGGVRLRDVNGETWFDAPGTGKTIAGHVELDGMGMVSSIAGNAIGLDPEAKTVFFVL